MMDSSPNASRAGGLEDSPSSTTEAGDSAATHCGRCAWCTGDRTPRPRGYELTCPHSYGCCANCHACSGHSACFALLKQRAAVHGMDVNVSEKRPGMTMPQGLEELAMRCPHGIEMWMEPTAEQFIRWREQGVGR